MHGLFRQYHYRTRLTLFLVYAQYMDTIELKDRIATVTLSEPEAKLLAVMAQYWIEELPSDDAGTQQLSDQLRMLACRFDVH